MCAPIIQSVTFDQANYTPGSTITATVKYTSCCTDPFTVSGGDSGGRTWTVIFNDGASIAQLQAAA